MQVDLKHRNKDTLYHLLIKEIHLTHIHIASVSKPNRPMFYSSIFSEPFGGSRNSIFESSFETQSLEIALVESKYTFE